MRNLFLALILIMSQNSSAEPLSLGKIYRESLKKDPALKAQTASTDAKKAVARQIMANRGLSVDASTIGSNTQDFKNDDLYQTGSVSVTFSLPLYDQSLDATIESKNAEARASEAKLVSFQQSQLLAVTKFYFSVLSAEQDLTAILAEVEAFERQLEQASERLIVGIGTRVDVDQARARLDLSQVNLISAEVALEAAKLDLQQIINTSVDQLLELGDDFDAVVHRDLPADLGQLVKAHPAVVARKQILRSALADLDNAYAEVSPTLALSSVVSLTDSSGSAIAAKNVSTQSNSISFSLTAPLYTNGRNKASILAAQSLVQAAEASLLAEERLVHSVIRIAYRKLQANSRTVEARRLAIVSAESRVEATETAYAVGSGDIVEVLNSKKDLIAAKRDFAKARYTHVVRQMELDRAIGDLSDSAIARIDRVLQ